MTPCCVPIENGKWHVVRGAWCVWTGCASLKKVEWILPYPCHWLNVLLLNPGGT